MTLADRLKAAVSILAVDAKGRDLKGEAEDLLATSVDEDCMEVLRAMANTAGDTAFERCVRQKGDLITACFDANTAVLIAGLAIGRRLGIEEGERFGRITASLEDGSGI